MAHNGAVSAEDAHFLAIKTRNPMQFVSFRTGFEAIALN
jgi:hypothetical protein